MCLSWFAGCAPLQTAPEFEARPDGWRAGLESDRDRLNALVEIDAVARVSNRALAHAMMTELQDSGVLGAEGLLREVRFEFSPQVIEVRAAADLNIADRTVPVRVEGEIRLMFAGDRLVWMPRFDRLEAVEPPPSTVESPEWRAAAKRRTRHINRRLIEALTVAGKNEIRLSAASLGTIELGFAPADGGETVVRSFPIPGVTVVAGSALLIERDQTTVALDLEFITDVSRCAAPRGVARSTFARNIRSREPRDIPLAVRADDRRLVYFTEIVGATESGTVVHYWFADGRAVKVEELGFEASARWRTWSAIDIDPESARQWQVIVADGETGCALDTGAINAQGINPSNEGWAGSDLEAWNRYRDRFHGLTAGFPAAGPEPVFAVLGLTREWLRNAMDSGLAAQHFSLSADDIRSENVQFEGELSLAADNMACPSVECDPQRECQVDFSLCERRVDTRDCRTCLLRNPLNNRCISEQIDADCDAIQKHNNRRFTAAWEACIADQEAKRNACESERAELTSSCEERAARQESRCAAVRDFVARQPERRLPLPVSLSGDIAGSLTLIYSDLRIIGDFAGLRADFQLQPNLKLEGRLDFDAAVPVGPVAPCLKRWTGDISLGLSDSVAGARRVAELDKGEGEMIATWPELSAMVRSLQTPSPAGSTRTEDDCPLEVAPGGSAGSRQVPDLLAGATRLFINPTPSRLRFAEMSVEFSGQPFRAVPNLISGHLHYEFHGADEVVARE